MPSETPSCTPSESPTPSPSINLFYPDQTNNGFDSGCLNDGAQPAWMEANPTNWMFSTLDRCCSQHFAWNYDSCMGNLADTCARALWYPDWEGTNDGCTRDGNEPYYMTANPSNFLFSTKADCCAEHYSYNMATCLGSSTSLASGNKWYADWTSGDETCKNDGQAPSYMVENDSLWLYTNKDDCCSRFFNYKLNDCKGSSSSAVATGKYFPDWEGNNEGCLIDSSSTPAPEYMSNSGTWLHDTLDACCEQHYGYRVEECKGVTSPATAGTNKWYIDWENWTCVKDCAVSNSDADCGGLAGTYGSSNLHASKSACCETHMSYDKSACLN